MTYNYHILMIGIMGYFPSFPPFLLSLLVWFIGEIKGHGEILHLLSISLLDKPVMKEETEKIRMVKREWRMGKEFCA